MITLAIALAMQTVGGPLPRVEHVLVDGASLSPVATGGTGPVSVRNDSAREMTVECDRGGVRTVLHVAAHGEGEVDLPDGLVSLRVAPAAPDGAVAVRATRLSSFLTDGGAMMVIDAASRPSVIRMGEH